MKFKKILAFGLALAMSLSMMAIPSFAMDIKETDWFYKDMAWLNTKVVITDANGNYKPNDAVDIQTFAKWFSPFLTVKTSKGPTELVTRNEAAKILSQSMGLEGKYKLPGYAFFTDSADNNVKLMCILQIMSGVGNNRFDGARTLSRAELAVLVHRVESLKGNYSRLDVYKTDETKDGIDIDETKDNTYDINDSLFVPTKKGDFYPVFENMMLTGVYSATFTYAEGTDINKYVPAMREAFAEITSDYYYFFSNTSPVYNYTGSTLSLSLSGSNILKSYDFAREYVKETLKTMKANGTIKDNEQTIWAKVQAITEYLCENFEKDGYTDLKEMIEHKEGSAEGYTALLNLFLNELGIKAKAINMNFNGGKRIVSYVQFDGNKLYVDSYACDSSKWVEEKDYKGNIVFEGEVDFIDLDHYFGKTLGQLNNNQNEKWEMPKENFGF